MVKIAIDPEGTELVDEAVVPLVLLAREHGLHPLDPCEGDETTPARLVFPTPEEALEFLVHTHHHSDFDLGDNLALTITPPENTDQHKGKVSWLPELTHTITEAWRMSRR